MLHYLVPVIFCIVLVLGACCFALAVAVSMLVICETLWNRIRKEVIGKC